jgi:hypothetical protein
MTDVTPVGPGRHPQGTIRLTIQGNEWTAGMLTPSVVVSGHRVNSRFGTMDVPVWAGPNRVEIHTTWVKDYGHASLDVLVRPGEVVPVFYAVPHHQFSAGSIGHERQQRKGLGGIVALLTVVALGCTAFVLVMGSLP